MHCCRRRDRLFTRTRRRTVNAIAATSPIAIGIKGSAPLVDDALAVGAAVPVRLVAEVAVAIPVERSVFK